MKETTFRELLEGSKPFIGKVKGDAGTFNYAINLPKSPDGNEFVKLPFGRQLATAKYLKEWKAGAKSDRVDAKGKATLQSVKDWVKENKSKEFYAKWTPDSSSYKDDSVEIFYK